MIRYSATDIIEAGFGVGLVLSLVAFFVVVLVVVAILETARWTRRSALELKAIRVLLEKQAAPVDDLPKWLGPQ